MRKLILFLLTIGMYYTAASQLMAGASIGTFNIPGASKRFKGIGPTVKLEYLMSERTSAFLDASLYNKNEDEGETTITDADGAYIGEAATVAKHSIRHLQLGCKALFRRDFDEKGLGFFIGGGVAYSLVKTTYKYTLPGYDIPDGKYNNNQFGFHFNAGAQYNFARVIVELKANFDLMIQPLVSASSYVITGSRLGVLIPITK
ncbi:MAG: hypothetical protein ABI675_07345 [Chitinophagaceae bacterium]